MWLFIVERKSWGGEFPNLRYYSVDYKLGEAE